MLLIAEHRAQPCSKIYQLGSADLAKSVAFRQEDDPKSRLERRHQDSSHWERELPYQGTDEYSIKVRRDGSQRVVIHTHFTCYRAQSKMQTPTKDHTKSQRVTANQERNQELSLAYQSPAGCSQSFFELILDGVCKTFHGMRLCQKLRQISGG